MPVQRTVIYTHFPYRELYESNQSCLEGVCTMCPHFKSLLAAHQAGTGVQLGLLMHGSRGVSACMAHLEVFDGGLQLRLQGEQGPGQLLNLLWVAHMLR